MFWCLIFSHHFITAQPRPFFRSFFRIFPPYNYLKKWGWMLNLSLRLFIPTVFLFCRFSRSSFCVSLSIRIRKAKKCKIYKTVWLAGFLEFFFTFKNIFFSHRNFFWNCHFNPTVPYSPYGFIFYKLYF